MRTAEHPAAKIEQFVERRCDAVAEAEIIAEIDEAVAVIKALADQVVDTRQPSRLAMDRADDPDPSRIAQMCEFFP